MPKRQKSKRWFAAASGWGLDFSLGSGDPKGSLSKVKRMLPLPSDAKITTVGYAPVTQKHNTIYTHNLMYPITQGTAVYNRIGDSLMIRAISVRVQVDNQTADSVTQGFQYRILVVATAAQDSSLGFSTGSIGSTNLFYTNVGGLIVAQIDPHLCKVICDQIYTYYSRPAPGVDFFQMDCVLGMPFEFQPGTNYGQAANLYALVIPYVTGGTVGTTIVAKMASQVSVTFSD